MSIPKIRPLPPAPVRQDGPADFTAKADAFVAALPGFGEDLAAVGRHAEQQASAAAGSVGQAQQQVVAARTAATQAAGSAQAAAGSATAAAQSVQQATKATQDAQIAAAAAGAAAGLPAMKGKGGLALVVSPDGTRVDFGALYGVGGYPVRITDPDTIARLSGFYETAPAAKWADDPFPGAWKHIIQVTHASTYATQRVMAFTGDVSAGEKVRSAINGVWQPWVVAGGGGAETAAKNLGAVATTGAQTVALDVGAARMFSLSLNDAQPTGALTVQFTNIPPSNDCVVSWHVELIRGGRKAITWPAGVRWTGGVPTFSNVANTRDVVMFYRMLGRTSIYAMLVDSGAV